MCEAYVNLLKDERTRGLAADPGVEARYVRWGEENGRATTGSWASRASWT
jgi:hypothetical protein